MINKKEVERYLGYGKNIPDERTTELIEECIRQIEKIAQPRSIYRIFDLKLKEDQIEAAGMKMQSRNLARNLKGCEKIVFFAATLGNEPDILMNRYSRLQISKAAVLQAVGAAAIEDYCNQCQKTGSGRRFLCKTQIQSGIWRSVLNLSGRIFKSVRSN